MINSKRAQAGLTGPQIVAILAFSIIVFIIIYVAIIDPFFISKGPSVASDEACHFNAVLDNALVIGETHPMQLWMCRERKVTIKANNWDKCPEEYKIEFDKAGKTESESAQETETEPLVFTGLAVASQTNTEETTAKAQVLKKCAAYQIAKLADRCWYMYGQGKLNFGALSYKNNCFKITVVNLIEDTKLNEGNIINGRKAVNQAGELKYGLLGGVRYGFPAQKSNQHISAGEAVSMYFCDHVLLDGTPSDDVLLYDCED